MRIRIKEAMQIAGINAKELAKRLGIAENTLSGYVTGKHDPKSDNLVIIARECGVTVDYILGLTDEPTQKKSPSEGSEGDWLQSKLAQNYLKMNEKGRRALLAHSELLLKDETNTANLQQNVVVKFVARGGKMDPVTLTAEEALDVAKMIDEAVVDGETSKL